MSDADQIRRVIAEYAVAVKRADMKELSRLCTPEMLRQFSMTVCFVIRLTRLLTPGRIRSLSLEAIEIEKQDAGKAVVSFPVSFGRTRLYERVILLKDSDEWRVDGKYV